MSGGHPNLYVYAGNDPVESADPSGTLPMTPAPWWAGLFPEAGPSADWDYLEEITSNSQHRDWFDNLTDFAAGMGDTISLGLTKLVRAGMGTEGYVDQDSGWYTGGVWAGRAWWAAYGGVSSGPRGWLFGRARYRPGKGAGILNRGEKLRIGWSWNNKNRWGLGNRNWFSIHGGKPGTSGHFHIDLIPWP